MLYNPSDMDKMYPYICCTTHGPWVTQLPCLMGHAMLYNIVQPMGHGHCTMLYGPWVMELCHVVWPISHGKKVAERCVNSCASLNLVSHRARSALCAPTSDFSPLTLSHSDLLQTLVHHTSYPSNSLQTSFQPQLALMPVTGLANMQQTGS